MRLKNNTNLPTELIRSIIRAITPPGVSGFDVRIANCSHGGRGRAYSQGSAFHDRACPFVVVAVPRTEALARCIWKPRGGYLGAAIGSRAEALVFILAHELRHLWQAKVKRGRRVWGARGQFSERDADAYALRALRAFRRDELLKAKGE